ncbi:FAD-dependent oxidoreductase [Weissella hellenica]|uniref:FAD-dependent oxidoreductase n=1 Tax=Weissella hellenica TaxID=46256 RepID=A0A4Y4G0V6_WEIHE|nr:FAD-dependent oxidoreductase [Weissella hellenica]NKY66670.1 FAD-dependent oxidoreductase [Weissella hellenica]GED35136.1 pyridine nucleotide-disulfide oxidoreductase [Weissella hellenica]SCB93327.1 NADPH-dependent 2,4-dienoyl-CoA reductase, sulfur reductase [Weissella hellenica]
MVKIAVIGSTHAGTLSATQIKQQNPDAEIIVYEKETTVSFLSCGIALWLGNHVSDEQRMFYETPESMTKQGITMKMQHEVVEANLVNKTVRAKNIVTSEMATESFDKIVIATGSKPLIPDIPGIDSENIYMIKSWEDAKRIKAVADDISRAIVIGAGYIGAEIAEQFSVTGKEVTLIDEAERVLPNNFSPVFTDRITDAFVENDVKLALSQRVTGFEDLPDGGIRVKTNKGSYEADIAVLGIGFLPNTDLFTDQVEMLSNGAIVTNEYMKTSVPGVFAAGDASTIFYNPTQQHDYIPLATNAIRQGMLIGRNINGHNLAYNGTQATSAVELYGYAMSATGMNKIGAQSREIDVVETTYEEDYRPDFMLSTTSVLSTITWEKETRRIVGAAFMSKHDTSQAANVVSVAIQNKMTIDDLAMADFFFQPNFTQPINFVGAVALKAVNENMK